MAEAAARDADRVTRPPDEVGGRAEVPLSVRLGMAMKGKSRRCAAAMSRSNTGLPTTTTAVCDGGRVLERAREGADWLSREARVADRLRDPGRSAAAAKASLGGAARREWRGLVLEPGASLCWSEVGRLLLFGRISPAFLSEFVFRAETPARIATWLSRAAGGSAWGPELRSVDDPSFPPRSQMRSNGLDMCAG